MIKCYQTKGWDLDDLLAHIEIDPKKIINIEHSAIRISQCSLEEEEEGEEEEKENSSQTHSIYWHIFVYYND